MHRELCQQMKALAWGQQSVLLQPQTCLESQAAGCVKLLVDIDTNKYPWGLQDGSHILSLICVPGIMLPLVSGGELLMSLLAANIYKFP